MMRVYHLLSAKWALDDLKRRRLKVTRFADLNDPFELLSVELGDPATRKHFNRWRKRAAAECGMLCFSKTWRNPVLWSHYADKHKGICLGFDVPSKLLRKVEYLPRRLPFDQWVPEEGIGPLFWTKFQHWEYEAEYRRIIGLHEAINSGSRHFWPFGKDLMLREIVAGARCILDEGQLKQPLGDLTDRVTRKRLAARSDPSEWLSSGEDSPDSRPSPSAPRRPTAAQSPRVVQDSDARSVATMLPRPGSIRGESRRLEGTST